jgi:hypothetical protein
VPSATRTRPPARGLTQRWKRVPEGRTGPAAPVAVQSDQRGAYVCAVKVSRRRDSPHRGRHAWRRTIGTRRVRVAPLPQTAALDIPASRSSCRSLFIAVNAASLLRYEVDALQPVAGVPRQASGSTRHPRPRNAQDSHHRLFGDRGYPDLVRRPHPGSRRQERSLSKAIPPGRERPGLLAPVTIIFRRRSPVHQVRDGLLARVVSDPGSIPW